MLGLFTLLVGLGAGDSLPPSQIVAKVQQTYEKTRTYKAEFRQVLTSTLYGRKQTFDGVVQFKKPGKMRWDYGTPSKKLFVSDGKVLWIYDPEDQQAFKQSFTESQMPAAVSFLLGTGKLEREFEASLVEDASSYGEPGDWVVRLVPKQPTTRIKEMVLDVDPKTFQVKQTFVLDPQGNINQVRFFRPVINPKLSDSLFQWSPPSGTRIIRSGS